MNKKRFLYITILILVTSFSVMIAKLLFTVPDVSLSEEEVLRGSGNQNDLISYYLEQLKQFPDSIEIHRSLIETYESMNVNFQPISYSLYYTELQSRLKYQDIYNYCMGYQQAVKGYADSALIHYDLINNRELPFLQNSLGIAHFDLNNDSLASHHFLKAISQNDNPEYAVYYLSKIYFKSKQFDKLKHLIDHGYLSNYISLRIRRYSHISNHEYISYLKNFLYVNFGNILPDGFLAGVLILLVWIGYLLRIDIFEKKKALLFSTTFILGALFSLLCTGLYDIFDLHFNLSLNGSYINDLLFSILGIGLIEESVKLFPFILLLPAIKKFCIDEPLDYIVFGAFSALGFAFMENVGYFHIYGLNTIFSRAQSASLLHMFFTVLPIYGVIRAHHNSKSPIAKFFIYFALSVVIHGVYDFFIIGEKEIHNYRQLAPLILILSIGLFQRIILHMLNISKSYSLERLEKLNHLSYYLGYSLFSVFILQFFIVAKRFGSSAAIDTLPVNIYTSLFPLFVIPMILGKFVICRGYLPHLLSPKQFKIPSELLCKYREDWKDYLEFNKGRISIIGNETTYFLVSLGKLSLIALYLIAVLNLTEKTENLFTLKVMITSYALLTLFLSIQFAAFIKSAFIQLEIDYDSQEITIKRFNKEISSDEFEKIKAIRMRGKMCKLTTKSGTFSIYSKKKNAELTLLYNQLKRWLISIKENSKK